ncbi:MAG: hypothetical protein HY303_17085 [Candidatus Wallbacteria bacterium]|nr:hypothetical protein [Candidatus Wallbacteria bacterium]
MGKNRKRREKHGAPAVRQTQAEAAEAPPIPASPTADAVDSVTPPSPRPGSARTRGLAAAFLVFAAIWTCGRFLDRVELVPPARLELPPDKADALVEPAAAGISGERTPALVAIVEQMRRSVPIMDKLRVLCRRLLELPAEAPGFPPAGERVLRRSPMTPARALAAWRSGQKVDPLTLAYVALELAAAGGLAARLVVSDDGAVQMPRGFAGIEVWLPEQYGWVLVDPAVGMVPSRPDAFLSLARLRDYLSMGEPVGVTPLVLALAPSSLGERSLEYRDRAVNLWVPVGLQRWGEGERPRAWHLLSDDTARTWPWWVRSFAAKLDRRLAVATRGYAPGLTTLLAALSGLAFLASLLASAGPIEPDSR